MIIVVMGVLIAVSVSLSAGDLVLKLHVDGGLDVWLQQLAFSAAIDGCVDVSGNVSCDGGMLWLLATGRALGVGYYNPLELMTRGWVLLEATGRADGGDRIVIRSLLYASQQSLVPLQAGDSFEGVHHTVVQIGDLVTVYGGGFDLAVSGGLAPSIAEGTIRLAGSGYFNVIGKQLDGASPMDYCTSIPFDDPILTEDFLDSIVAFFELLQTEAPVLETNAP